MDTTKRIALTLALALFPGAAALADDAPGATRPAPAAKAPRPQLVGVMLSSAQVLIWDEAASEYQLRRLGDSFAGGQIAGIDADRIYVERDGGGGGEEIALQPAPQVRMPVPVAGGGPATLILGSAPAAAAAAAPAKPAAPAPPAPIAAPQQPAAPAPPAIPAAPQQSIPVENVAPQQPAAPPALPVPAMAPPAIPAAPPAPMMMPPPPPIAPAPPAPMMMPPPPPPPVAPAPPAPMMMPPPPAPMMMPSSVGYLPPAAAPSAIVVHRGEFESQLGDLERVANDVSLAAISGAGYRLMSIRPGSYVERLGLRPGDVLLTVDGRAILSPDDAARAFAWLRLTDRFSVDVLRDGARLTLRYEIAG